MTEYDSESLPFESPEQENIRLRAENARLRRLLAHFELKLAHYLELSTNYMPATQPELVQYPAERSIDVETSRFLFARIGFKNREVLAGLS